MKQIGIIGGGASGMMAAITAATNGKVTILEHTDQVVKKILSTGNGKCNYTNLVLSKDDYFGNHPSFLMHVMDRFGPEDMTRFLNENGILTTNKRDGYMYPFSGQASTISDFFQRQAKKRNVKIIYNVKIEEIFRQESNDSDVFVVKTKQGSFQFDKLILACGGQAFESSGSDGSGFAYAKSFGLQIHKMYPVLTPIFVKDSEKSIIAGVRANASATVKVDGTALMTDTGEVQFTKDAVSGIPVFQLTHYATRAFGEGKEVQIWIDFLPQMKEEESITYFEQLSYMNMSSIYELMSGMLHEKVVKAILHRLKIAENTSTNELSRKQWKKINSCIHNFVFTMAKQSDFQKAQATSGGVSLEEIDENMMVKKVPGLYIVGEMLDMDGKCGGYNLQWAFSSGYIAGSHCVAK